MRHARRAVRRARRRARAGIRSARKTLAEGARGYHEARQEERLRATPLLDLKKVGVSNVRWKPLETAGIRTLADLGGKSPSDLSSIPGVGPTTARAVTEGAQRLREGLRAEPVDVPSPREPLGGPAADVVRAAWGSLAARDELVPAAERLDAERQDLRASWRSVRRATSFLSWVLRRELGAAREQVARAEERVRALEAAGVLDAGERAERPPADESLRADLRARYADYAAVIEEELTALRRREGLAPEAAGETAAGERPQREPHRREQ